MRKILLTLLALLSLGGNGAWAADIAVTPSNGVYWKNGAVTSDAWAPIWKSNAKASDMTTPMLVLTGETGMNTANGDIYSNQTYTLEAPSGYTIVSYSFNGTATDGDVTITPAGGSGTLISNGNSLGSPLSVAVGAQSTTFALSGDGHISSLALTVKVEHYIVTYSTSTGTYTTTDNFVNTWNSTATDPQVTFSVSGGANNIAKSTGYIYSGANGCTYVLTAQGGYIITGYEIVGTAQTSAQTLTPAAGGSATTFATSGTTTLTVTGLSTQSTTFTQSTPNNGIAISSFKIFLEKDPCTVTYVISDASGVIYTSDPMGATVGETITELPSSLQRPYCTYSVTSTTIESGENTVPVTLTAYNPPFTVSSDFASATWYYATLRGKQLRADESAKDGSGRYQTNSTNERTDVYKWAFVGNPYKLSIINKGAGDSKCLYMGTQPVMQAATPASDNKARWVVSANSNGGFTVRSESGATMYINDAGNGGNLGYWNSSNGANDMGGNWVISEVSASDKALLEGALTTANSLYSSLNSGAGKLGYPTVAALSTFNTAINTAQGVYDNPSGDYVSAYTTLNDAIVAFKASFIYTPRTDVYYTIVNARGAMIYDPSHDESVDATNENAKYLWYGSTTPDDSNVNNLWGFIEQDGHYYMYNVGKQQFATVGTGTYGSTWIFSDTPSYITLDDGIADEIAAPKVRIRATIATTGNSYSMSVSTNYTGPVITYDSNGDGGVPMLFTESATAVDASVTDIMVSKVTDLTPFKNALKTLIDECALITTGTGLNEYTAPNEYATALADAQAVYADGDATQSELQTATSNLESAMAGLSINLPASGSFIRIKTSPAHISTPTYLTSQNKLVEQYYNCGFTQESSKISGSETILYYDGTSLLGYSTGLWLKNNGGFAEWYTDPATSGTSVVFMQAGNGAFGRYNIKFNGARYLYTRSEGLYSDAAGNVGTDEGYNFILEEVTSLPITISSIGFNSFYCPVDVIVPEGVTAYAGKISGDVLNLTPISAGGKIPANTGVILEGSAGANVDFTITSDASSIVSDLTGTVAAKAKTEGDLVLGYVNEKVGFYAYSGANLAGFKSYIAADAAQSVKALGFNFVETAIQALLQAGKDNVVYDLNGRQVQKAKKGLYIVNGHKVVIR